MAQRHIFRLDQLRQHHAGDVDNIVRMLTQRRHGHGNDAQFRGQVAIEFILLHQAGQRFRCCADQAHIVFVDLADEMLQAALLGTRQFGNFRQK